MSSSQIAINPCRCETPFLMAEHGIQKSRKRGHLPDERVSIYIHIYILCLLLLLLLLFFPTNVSRSLVRQQHVCIPRLVTQLPAVWGLLRNHRDNFMFIVLLLSLL